MSILDADIVTRFDAALDEAASVLRGHPLADRLFYAMSTAGDHGMLWHVIAASRAATGADTWREAVEVSSALGVEAAIVNGPVKMLFRRQRPVGHERPHHLRTPRTSSFPSGHASAGMFAAVLFAARTRRRWPWYILGALMGWSRVHVKIHHPSDVIGGAAVGLVLGRVGLWALEALDPVSA